MAQPASDFAAMSDYDEESGEEQVYDEEEEVIDDDEAASGEDDGEGEDDEENEEGDEEAEELEDGDGDAEDEEEVEDGEEVDDDEGESEEVEEGDDEEEVDDEESDEEEEEEEEGEDDEEEEEEEEEEGEQLDGDDDDEEEADQEEEEVDDDGEDRELQEGEEEEVEKKDKKKKRPAGGLKKAVGANVIMISGCMDDQTSADGLGTGRPGGGAHIDCIACPDNVFAIATHTPYFMRLACTQALLKSMPRAQNWVDLLKRMYTVLGKAEKPQIPMLTTSRPFDMDAPVEVFQGTGNHKSLFIGINYVGQGANELSGCHADVEAMREFAMKEGFSNDSDHMLVLMDNGRHMMPTHLDGDEEDGQDEAMYSVDDLEIVDDDIYQHIINPLQDGVNFTILMDCCHSGSILDLPYTVLCSEQNMRSWDAGTKPQMQANRNFTAKARGSAGQLTMKKPSGFTLARNLAMELGIFCLGKLEAQNSTATSTKATKKSVTKTTTTKKKVVKKAAAPDGDATAVKKAVPKKKATAKATDGATVKKPAVKKAAADGTVAKKKPAAKKTATKKADGTDDTKTATKKTVKKTTSTPVRKAPLSSVTWLPGAWLPLLLAITDFGYRNARGHTAHLIKLLSGNIWLQAHYAEHFKVHTLAFPLGLELSVGESANSNASPNLQKYQVLVDYGPKKYVQPRMAVMEGYRRVSNGQKVQWERLVLPPPQPAHFLDRNQSTIVTILGVITIASIIKIIRKLAEKGKTEWTNRKSNAHHPLQKPARQSAPAVSSMAAQTGPQAKKTK
ncbi:hypothetical protein JKP88DRAFT_264919 [Tribonema minus]|uniref:Peptidase C14 caspase domain-containing protein n=1 Tax=Tribonema minus TaxID=303371 RepID=A0A835YW48_9STRA|nr:hypothetical protein JKP88DRAFT_264919 [Tribonema minus]